MNEWDTVTLFKKTFPITTHVCKLFEEEIFISNQIKYMDVIKKILIMMEIAAKLSEQINKFQTTKQEYFDDPDDPPIPRIEMFQFVECDKYMTREGLIKFDLNYVIERTENMRKY
jgi:hypothetical protein